ncbi:hypothetical protein ACO0KY_16825 [Undibacterium sp. Dicai25W]|uniref:hypothetical protein n=1 Tax=Undibacterium sp. Dicai25W TaxID=3413034 RepID=UPI003BF2022E
MRGVEFTPGSFLWLLMHEWRMFFYEMGDASKLNANSKKSARGMPLKGKLLLAVVWILMHYLAWEMMSDLPALTRFPSFLLLVGISFVLLILMTFMLSSALNRSIKALFERGDLDLLLSSPISTQTIFNVRLTGIVLGVLAIFVFFLSPVIDAGLFLGQIYWLGAYPVLVGMAMLASAAAMLLTLSLVKFIGVKRTHTVAYLLSALSGAAIFLSSQIFSHVQESTRQKVIGGSLSYLDQHHLLAETSPIWLPARAVFGDWLSALMIFASGLIICWLTTRYMHHFFVRGVQQAGGVSPKVIPDSRARKVRRFYSGVWLVIFVKEWRLILRDFELLAQICLQLLYMLPLFFVVFKNGVMLPGVVSGLTYLGISLAGSLIWVILSAEDAPDLLQCAPLSMKQIIYAKLVTAVLPVCALIAPAVLGLSWHDPLSGVSLAIASFGGIFCASLIHLWLSKPATRDHFKRRGQGNLIPMLLETLNAFSWTGMAFGLQTVGKWAWFGALGAVVVLIIAWLMRVRRL